MGFNKKLLYLILISSILFPILLYQGAIDPFAPMHISPIQKLLYFGYGGEDFISKTPEFYIFGTILTLLGGIPKENLIFLPIQLLPIIFLFFITFRKISCSYIVASLLTLIYSLSDITGNKFYFWIHGMGMILFFLIVYSLINLLENINKFQSKLIIIISTISLIFISYDVTFLIICIEVSIILLIFINKKSWFEKKQFVSLFSILLIVQLGLSNFVYRTIIPNFRDSQNSLESIEMFIYSFRSSAIADVPETSIIYPKILGTIGSLKYGILLFSLLFTLLVVFIRFKNLKFFENYNIIFLSFFFMAIGYGLAKLHLGQVQIGAIFMPGIVSLSLLYRIFKKKIYIKNSILIIIIILILLSFMYFYLFNDYNLINRDRNKYNYIESPAKWYLKYSNGIGLSDIQTKSLFSMYISKFLKMNTSYNIDENFYTLNPADKIISQNKNTSTNNIIINYYIQKDERYYILNTKLNFLTIDKWRTLKPWRYYKDKIEENHDFIKIFSNNDIEIFSDINKKSYIL